MPTQLQRLRWQRDIVISALYHYARPRMGYASVGALFGLGIHAVRAALERTPPTDPSVRALAAALGLRPADFDLLPTPDSQSMQRGRVETGIE